MLLLLLLLVIGAAATTAAARVRKHDRADRGATDEPRQTRQRSGRRGQGAADRDRRDSSRLFVLLLFSGYYL